MDINTIVTGLYLDRRVNEMLGKLEPAELRFDLLHHCILYVYKIAAKAPGKIEGLAERGELFAWFSRCLKLELIGKNSAFHRTFRGTFEQEEVLMTNEEMCKVVDSKAVTDYQRSQDAAAEARHGKQFVDYFYDNYHKRLDRKDKMLRLKAETKQAVLF